MQLRFSEKGAGPDCYGLSRVSKASLSLSLMPELAELRDELAKVAVLSLVEGVANESHLLEVVPSIINRNLTGPITPLNDCNFLLPLASREEVKALYKLGSFTARTKDGPCGLKIASWSAELGAVDRTSGRGSGFPSGIYRCRLRVCPSSRRWSVWWGSFLFCLRRRLPINSSSPLWFVTGWE